MKKKRTCPDCKKTHYRKDRNLCFKCKHEREKKRDPYGYHYRNLRSNAKRRGIGFSLTLDQFKEFCIRTEYLNGVGRSSESLTIDRIRSYEGYHKDNIQVLTNGDNVRKKWIEWHGKNEDGSNRFRYVSDQPHEPTGTAPF